MKLYVCWGTFSTPWGHPCKRAHDALKEAGHRPQVIKAYGERRMPAALNRTAGRREVKALTGDFAVPVLVTDDGEIVQDSKRIVEWAQRNPAKAAA